MNILIVEDHEPLARLIQRMLAVEQHTCETAHDGAAAVELAHSGRFQLVVLDLNLPVLDGLEVLAQIRGQLHDVPILVVTGRAGLDERVRCLNLGADDCLTKPFAPLELQARISALLRRSVIPQDTVLRFADVELHRLGRTVIRSGRPIDLTTREFALLESLMQRNGRTASRAELLKEVWGVDPTSETNVLDVYMTYLRRKLDDGAGRSLIHTARGKGYFLKANSPQAHSSRAAHAVLPVTPLPVSA